MKTITEDRNKDICFTCYIGTITNVQDFKNILPKMDDECFKLLAEEVAEVIETGYVPDDTLVGSILVKIENPIYNKFIQKLDIINMIAYEATKRYVDRKD